MKVEVEGNPVLLATRTYGPEGNCVLAIGSKARIVGGESRLAAPWRSYAGSPPERWTGRTSPGSTTGSSSGLHYRAATSDRRSRWAR